VKKVQGRGKFYGIDISQKMLDLARARATDLGYTNVEFNNGDAERLDFPESSFDLVISNQAFFFFPNKQKALNEMFRVLKPIGKAALLFFGEPSLKEIKEIYVKIRDRHTKFAKPGSLKLIDLEETHELLTKRYSRNPESSAFTKSTMLILLSMCLPLNHLNHCSGLTCHQASHQELRR
jgi:demethylmenaquinone methyltransferase/2-methoxy-6-polyprenyl-1,4-benzoquinol methylase